MSPLARRVFFAFAILTLGTAVLLGLWLTGRGLLPGFFPALPPWLPEDSLAGVGFLFLSDLIHWLPALVFSSILLTVAFWLKTEELPSGEVRTLVRSSLLAILVTVLFSFFALFLEPWIDARLSDLEFRKTQAAQLEDAYLKLKALGPGKQTTADLEARMSLLKRLGLLRPTQGQQGGKDRMDYDFELQILKAHFELGDFFLLRALPGVADTPPDWGTTVEDLLTRAEEALADGSDDREFQANLWAFQVYRRLANAADQGKPIPSGMIDRAKEIIDTSWQRIYEKTLAADERLKASYFFRKGKSLGDFQFQNFLEAYYGFQELRRENPQDQEVNRYWELSREKVADQVLFIQDLEVLFAVPGSENLVYLNRTAPLEIVRIGKLLNTSQGVFLKDFEFLRVDGAGKPLVHWTAPYGRWGQDGIDFRVWEKETPVPRFPVVLSETPGNEFDPLGEVDPPRFQPTISVQALEVVNSPEMKPQTLGTWDLLVHGQAIEVLGYNSRLFQTEFVVRLLSPFGFFVAVLFVLALAWNNRAHDPGRSWWVLIPALPLVFEFLIHSLLWATRLSVGGLLTTLGLTAGAVVLGILFLVLSATGIVLVDRAFRNTQA